MVLRVNCSLWWQLKGNKQELESISIGFKQKKHKKQSGHAVAMFNLTMAMFFLEVCGLQEIGTVASPCFEGRSTLMLCPSCCHPNCWKLRKVHSWFWEHFWMAAGSQAWLVQHQQGCQVGRSPNACKNYSDNDRIVREPVMQLLMMDLTETCEKHIKAHVEKFVAGGEKETPRMFRVVHNKKTAWKWHAWFFREGVDETINRF